MMTGPNWARRYRTNHRRLCARAGCGLPAAATLRFQPTQREAWLVDLDEESPRTEGDLCARHAGSLVLPRGWQLHDHRARPPEDVIEPAPARVRAPRRALNIVTPKPTVDDELADVLDAQTPLLKRAFQNVLPLDDE